jgi:hypothetical protein
MWDGITYVDPDSRPVIHEGTAPARAVVMNAGPAAVSLLVWNERTADRRAEPTFTMHMPAGNARSVGGAMIAVGLPDEGKLEKVRFAAVAWRMVP